MAAEYPSGAKSFTPIVDGVDFPQATDVNQAYDELSAIETALLNGLAHHLLFTDATYDIGQSGATRPRNLFLSADLVIGSAPATEGAIRLANAAAISARNGVNTGNITIATTDANSDVILGDANRNVKINGGNLGLGTATFGTNALNTLALLNGTVPATSPADTVQLFSADISAGNASLGIRTETAVVTESVTSDRTLSVTINGTVYKLCLKA